MSGRLTRALIVSIPPPELDLTASELDYAVWEWGYIHTQASNVVPLPV